MKNKPIYLQDQTWEEAEKLSKKNPIILLPVGATEEHGPAGALGLDTYNAIYLAEDVSAKSGAIIAPPIWYGDSAHHGGFAGTISLQSETLISVLKDVLSSLVKHSFKKIVIINGHKIANLSAITIAAKYVHEYIYPNSIICIADPSKIANISSKIKGDVIEHHAGMLEVSELMYKRPDLVRVAKLNNANFKFSEVFSKWSKYDLYGKSENASGDIIDIMWNSYEQKKFSKNGQFSDNSQANVEVGKKYHHYMAGVIVEFVQWLSMYKGVIGSAY